MCTLKDFYWAIVFRINGFKYYKYGGGQGDTVQAPKAPDPIKPPSALQTSRESTQAQLEALPQQLAAQKEFGPQFTQLQLDQLKEFGGQFTEQGLDIAEEFGGRLSQLSRQEQEVLAPERVAGSDAVAKFLKEGGDDLSPEEESRFLEDVRAAQSTRGLSQSGFGAVDELKKITGLRQSFKDRFLNVALSASGRLPGASGSSVAAPGFNQSNLVKGVDPQTFFGGQQSNNAANASIFGNQSGMFNTGQNNATDRRGQNLAMIGEIVGGVAGGAGMAIGKCWVAKEIFGSWSHPRVHEVRYWITYRAPRWFDAFYTKHGKKIAEFISDKPFIKSLLKPLFLRFASEGRKSWVL